MSSLPTREVPSRPSPRRRNAGLLLFPLLVLAAAIRFHSLPQLGFWTDELFSLSDANGWGLQAAHLPGVGLLPADLPHPTRRVDRRGWGAMFEELSRSEIHPPLYFALLRGWEDLLGGAEDEVSVRSLSVLFSLAAIALLYGAVREQHPIWVALWACALMTVAGPQIEYAQEARNYMPMLTFGLAAVWALLRIERLGVNLRREGALAASLVAMLLTNYFSITVVATLGIYLLLQFSGRARRDTVVAFVASGIVFLVLWGRFLLRQLPRFAGGHTWLLVPTRQLPSRELHALLTWPTRGLLEMGDTLTRSPWPIALGLLWLLVPIGLARRSTRLWALLVIVPLVVVGISDVQQSMSQLSVIRFTLAATPGLYVLIAAAGEPLAAVTWLRDRFTRGAAAQLLPALCTLLAAAYLPAAYLPPWKSDWRTPATALNARLSSADALVFVGVPNDDFSEISLQAIRHYLTRDPAVLAALLSPADDALLDRLQHCRTVWVIARPTAPLEQDLPGLEIEERGDVPGMVLVLRGRIAAPAAGGRAAKATALAPPPRSLLRH